MHKVLNVELTEKEPNAKTICTEEILQEDAGPVQAKSGRLYIPHGHGEEKPFIPHISHQKVYYSECGPDWKSKLRWLPSPKPGDGKPTENTFYPPLTSIRHFPYQHNVKCEKEYSFYRPHGTAVPKGNGKRTYFEEVHRASLISSNELTDSMRFGNRGYPACQRNGISEASPGDKTYQVAEYSPGFHQSGSTRPVVNFGQKRVQTRLRPTVVLSESTSLLGKPYTIKEAERRLNEEINVVRSLSLWQPAAPLVVPIFEGKSTA